MSLLLRGVLLVACWLGDAPISYAAVKLNDLVTPCSITAKNLDECLTVQGRALLPHLLPGIKEWDIVPLDPLFVPSMELQRNDGSSLGLSIRVVNSTQYGWKDMVIHSIKMDPKTYQFSVKWLFPKYIMLGQSETNGRLILLPISGRGAANMTFLNAEVEMRMKTTPEERGSKKYLKVTEVTTVISIQKLIMQLDNLLNNADISTTMNRVMNENSLSIFEELRPNIQDIFSDITQSLISRIFYKVPLNKLFTDVE